MSLMRGSVLFTMLTPGLQENDKYFEKLLNMEQNINLKELM